MMKQLCIVLAVTLGITLGAGTILAADFAATSELPAALQALGTTTQLVTPATAESVRGEGGAYGSYVTSRYASGVYISASGYQHGKHVQVVAAGSRYAKVWIGKNDIVAKSDGGKFYSKTVVRRVPQPVVHKPSRGSGHGSYGAGRFFYGKSYGGYHRSSYGH